LSARSIGGSAIPEEEEPEENYGSSPSQPDQMTQEYVYDYESDTVIENEFYNQDQAMPILKKSILES
jgi:hypothetical protein